MIERVALYLQDAHDLRDGLDYVKYAEQRGFEAVWQAESRLVRGRNCPDGGLRSSHGQAENWLRRDQQLDPQHRPSGSDLSHSG